MVDVDGEPGAGPDAPAGAAGPRLLLPPSHRHRVGLDPSQQAVVDRAGAGPGVRLLVLAGPGTGKTTTLVETVAARVEAGVAPERVLALTFSRKAAQELRARLAARLDRTLAVPLAWTFHGFCYHVLTALGRDEPDLPPVRLMPGPVQDVAVRELVAGALDDGRSPWPPELTAALRTRGFADELRALLARARSLGMEPADLAAASDRPDWRAAARFFEEYLAVLDARGVVDHSEVVHRAARMLESATPPGAPPRYDLVVVDEYQDTDPAQESLLRALVPPGSPAGLVVVGDPDQSIYAFRGADVSNLTEFPVRFSHADGRPAEVLPLRVCRRSGGALLAASRAVLRRAPVPGRALPTEALRDHRDLRPAEGLEPGSVQVVTFGHEAAEAQGVAEVLRREHLERGTPWERMAVVVRSATRSLPRLRRALASAGVPVEVAADEVPLVHEPAARVLVDALACAVDLAGPRPGERLDAETARALLTSPLGGADAAHLRRLGRALRAEARAADGTAPSSAALLRDCLLDPSLLLAVEERLARPAARLAATLHRAAGLVADGAGAYRVLWELWSSTPWPQRLEAASRRGGADGRRADHDLDAVLALFDAADEHDAQPGRGSGAANFVDVVAAQQVPGDTLAEKGVRPGGVRLLTAHRSKGLEWDVVVVAGVEEDCWPDVRRRGTLLQPERLERDGESGPASPAEVLAEERRLFYVACTRARRRLVVTAVDSDLEDGPRASRFLDDLGVERRHVERTPRRPLSLRGLVADLRRVAVDPASSDALRAAAVERLGALAAVEHDGAPLVPEADPRAWWGLRERTRAEVPLAPPETPLRLSGSSLRGLDECPARWLLAHEVRASGPRGTAMGFGSVVHALADAVVRGTLPAEADFVMKRLDEVWDRLGFEASWQRELEREAARDALSRFLVWHRRQEADGRRPVATEEPFAYVLEVDVADGDAAPADPREAVRVVGPLDAEPPAGDVAPGDDDTTRRVVVRGFVDRVDLDADGRVVVVDYKTGRSHPSGKAVEVDPQLATYQLAVESGALDHVLPAPRPEVAGAELVQLRVDPDRVDPGAKVQRQPDLRAPTATRTERDPEHDGEAWFHALVRRAAARVAHEDLPAVVGQACQTCEFVSSCPARDEGRGVVT